MKSFRRVGFLAIDPLALDIIFGAPLARENEDCDGVAIVTVSGPLTAKDESFFDSYEKIRERARAAFESSRGVVLRVNSPGGEVSGCFELAAELREMAKAARKPLVAFVDGLACSAAYALATAGDRIVAPASARVGSIGVINMLISQAEAERRAGLAVQLITSGARKGDGSPHVDITDDAVAALQHDVDALAGQFFALVAGHRSISGAKVQSFEAATFIAPDAKAVGLIDEIGSLDRALAMVAGTEGISGSPPAAKAGTMTKAELVAALKAMAEGDSDDADKARAALKAMGEGEPDGDEKAEGDEPDGDEPKEKPKPVDDGAEGDDEEPKAKASAARQAEISLAATVAEQGRRLRAVETREERTRLLASRPDLMKEKATADWLRTAPIQTVRDAVKAIPKATAPKPAAAAQAGVKPTLGETHGETQNASSSEGPTLAQRMGNAPATGGIRREQGALVLGVMTPAQARAHMAKLAEKGGVK